MDKYIYIVAVGFAGSVVGFLKNESYSLKKFTLRLADGCFSAYIVFESVNYYIGDFGFSLAMSAMGAYFGSDIFTSLKELLFDKFKKE